MQIEIESYFGDAWIVGQECSEFELISNFVSLYKSVLSKDFASVFCKEYSFKVIPLSEDYPSPEWFRVCRETDYRFDLDVGIVFKHQKSQELYTAIYRYY